MPNISGANSNNSNFETLLNLYNQMYSEQQQLELDLKSGNKEGAEADIEKLQSLISDMNLVGHEQHISTGPVAIDTVYMENQLDRISADIDSGHFQNALQDDVGISGALGDLFQRLV